MADNADFSGGRLRLTAFLRAVENGMPQRPSRLKRNPQLPNTGLISIETIALEAPRTARTPCPVDDSTVEGARTDGPSLTEDGSQHISRSPDLEEVTSTDAIGHEKRPTSDFVPPVDTGSQIDVMTSARPVTKRPPKENRKSVRPRDHPKRQPPCLPLLRTTTSDGLPDPLDARTTFAVPIAEVDPIHDTQQTTARPMQEHVSMSKLHKVKAESKVLKNDRKSKHPDSFQVQTRTAPCSRPKKAPIETRPTQNQVLTLHGGFVGEELNINSSRKTCRRAEKNGPQPKPKIRQRGLQLATGELPQQINDKCAC